MAAAAILKNLKIATYQHGVTDRRKICPDDAF